MFISTFYMYFLCLKSNFPFNCFKLSKLTTEFSPEMIQKHRDYFTNPQTT